MAPSKIFKVVFACGLACSRPAPESVLSSPESTGQDEPVSNDGDAPTRAARSERVALERSYPLATLTELFVSPKGESATTGRVW